MKVRVHLKWAPCFYLAMVIFVASAIISALPMTGAASPLLGGYAVFGSGVTIGNSSRVGHFDVSSPDHSFIGGQIVAEGVSIGNSTLVGGIYAADGNLTLGNYARAAGVCSILGGALNLGNGASCAGLDQGGDETLVGQLIIDSLADFYNFDIQVLVNCATATMGPLTVAAGKSSTVSTTVPGFNLIQADAITLGNSSTLTLSAGPGDSILLHSMNNLVIGSGAHIKLKGGIVPSHVMIYVEGDCNFGNSIGIAASVALVGQLSAGSGTFVDGLVLATGGVTFGPNTIITNNDSEVSVPEPSPECQALHGY
jgi:hypothetical protein